VASVAAPDHLVFALTCDKFEISSYSPMTESTAAGSPPSQRRSNFILRALIDEMLEQVRELDRHSAAWTPAERAQREREVDDLMARVRRAAMKGPPA